MYSCLARLEEKEGKLQYTKLEIKMKKLKLVSQE